MAEITLQGSKINTLGELPKVGEKAPHFTLVDTDLSEFSLEDFAGKRVVLNVVPSVDTGICAKSARRFNEEATSLDNTVIITVSVDLPFALGRFCAAEGIEDARAGSAFRSTFGKDYSATITDGPMKGLLSRAVIVLDENREILYTEQVPEIAQEPNYDAALAALD